MGTQHSELELNTTTMKFLLVCTVISAASAALQVALPYGYGVGLHGLGYGYGGYPLTYAAPHIIKPVAKEVEVPVKTLEYKVAETGCTNVFGFRSHVWPKAKHVRRGRLPRRRLLLRPLPPPPLFFPSATPTDSAWDTPMELV